MYVTNTNRKCPNSCGYCYNFDYNTLKDVNTFVIPDKYPKNVHPNSPDPPRGRDIIDIWKEKKCVH